MYMKLLHWIKVTLYSSFHFNMLLNGLEEAERTRDKKNVFEQFIFE